jgi:hypothetical protein
MASSTIGSMCATSVKGEYIARLDAHKRHLRRGIGTAAATIMLP